GGTRTILTSRPDGGYAHLGVSLVADHVFRVIDDLPPQVLRAADLNLVVMDVEVDWLFGRAFDHQIVIARKTWGRTPVAPGVRRGNGPGQRRFGHHHVPSAGRGIGAGYRSGGKNQRVALVEGIDLGIHIIHQELATHAPPADIVLMDHFGTRLLA